MAGITVACDLSGASEGTQEIQQQRHSSRPRKQLLPPPSHQVGEKVAVLRGVGGAHKHTHTHACTAILCI